MASITTHLLVKNQARLLKRALQSLKPLGGSLIVADLGSDDETFEVAESLCDRVFRVANCRDRSRLRNQIVSQSDTEWHFYIEPWEVVTNPEAILASLNGSAEAYHLPIIKGDVITKEERLWRTGRKFKNPVYETLFPSGDMVLDSLIYSDGFQQDNSDLLFEWRRDRPADSEAIYYEACQALVNKQYSEFMKLSSHYLFDKQHGSMSVIMTKYYRAVVNSLINHRVEEAIKEILECISIRPLMAEFWCVLGDIYYSSLREYSKSQHFYETAIILGNRRLNEDLWPMQLSKYEDYPKQMIESCRKIRKESLTLKAMPKR